MPQLETCQKIGIELKEQFIDAMSMSPLANESTLTSTVSLFRFRKYFQYIKSIEILLITRNRVDIWEVFVFIIKLSDTTEHFTN